MDRCAWVSWSGARRNTTIDRASTSMVSPAFATVLPASSANRGRVRDRLPGVAPSDAREGEGHRLVIGVEQQEKRVVGVLLAAASRLQCVTVEEHAERLREALCPVVFFHLVAGRREPRDVADLRAMDRSALEERPPSEHAVLLAELDHPAGERRAVLRRRAPSRTRRCRCPGSTRCCCPAVSGRSRRRRAAWGCPARRATTR